MRSVRETAGAAWVDAVLRGEAAEARRHRRRGAAALPFLLTRDLDAMRAALRGFARGQRRAGLVRCRRREAAARPRGSALQVPTEVAGLVPATAGRMCAPRTRWRPSPPNMTARGWNSTWSASPGAATCCARRERLAARALRRRRAGRCAARRTPTSSVNTYRVLLTRARYETVIWVPRGIAARATPSTTRTRDAAEMDAIADFLLACGARPLEAARTRPRARRSADAAMKAAMRPLLIALLALLALPAAAQETQARHLEHRLADHQAGRPSRPAARPRARARPRISRGCAPMPTGSPPMSSPCRRSTGRSPPRGSSTRRATTSTSRRDRHAARRLRLAARADRHAQPGPRGARPRAARAAVAAPRRRHHGASRRRAAAPAALGPSRWRLRAGLDPRSRTRATARTSAARRRSSRDWIAARRREGVAFAILGDFNRRMERNDEFLAHAGRGRRR